MNFCLPVNTAQFLLILPLLVQPTHCHIHTLLVCIFKLLVKPNFNRFGGTLLLETYKYLNTITNDTKFLSIKD